VWRSRYVWRAGFWVDYRPNWIWIPAHYRWTPAGYVFIDGYWDYPLADRGMLFAPVYIPRTVYMRASYYYSPTIVVRDDCMYGALFVRRGSYYFGDYFGPTYATAGYVSWVGYSGGRDVVVVRGYYDPMYSYYRVTYREDPYWRTGITELYVGRYKGDIPPPPRTLVQQNTIINNTTIVNNNITVNNKTTNVTNVTMLSSINTAAKVKNVQVQNVPTEARQQHLVESRQVQTFAQQRGQQETKLVAQGATGAKLDAPRTMKLDVPKNYAARAVPAAHTLTTSTINSFGKIDPKGVTSTSTNAPKLDRPSTTTTPKTDPKSTVVNPKGPTNPGGIVVPARQDPKAPLTTGTSGDPKPMGGTGGVGTVPTGPSLIPPPKNTTPMTTTPPPKGTPRPKPKEKEKDR
jgi:hypothetical protein